MLQRAFQNASFPEELIPLSFTLYSLAPEIRMCGDSKGDHFCDPHTEKSTERRGKHRT
jgi:hypothetical protein